MKVVILGGGPSGLLAAFYVQRHHPEAEVVIVDRKPLGESQRHHPFFIHEDLPPEVGLQLEETRVMEIVEADTPANIYAIKTIGQLSENVLWGIPSQQHHVRTGRMASDLIQQLMRRINLMADGGGKLRAMTGEPAHVRTIGAEAALVRHVAINVGSELQTKLYYDYLISTISMPALLDVVGWGDELKELGLKLNYADAFSIVGDARACDHLRRVCQIYYGVEQQPWARFSNMRGLLSWELSAGNNFHPHNLSFYTLDARYLPSSYQLLRTVMQRDGVPDFPLQAIRAETRFIPPSDRAGVRSVIYRLTQKLNILSLGRFAVFEYKRVDHVAHDAEKIALHIKRLQLAR